MSLALAPTMYRGDIMIVREQVPGRPDLVKTYSDEHFYIKNDQTDQIVEYAIDLNGTYTYTETDQEIIEDEDFKRTYEMLNIIMGK